MASPRAPTGWRGLASGALMRLRCCRPPPGVRCLRSGPAPATAGRSQSPTACPEGTGSRPAWPGHAPSRRPRPPRRTGSRGPQGAPNRPPAKEGRRSQPRAGEDQGQGHDVDEGRRLQDEPDGVAGSHRHDEQGQAAEPASDILRPEREGDAGRGRSSHARREGKTPLPFDVRRRQDRIGPGKERASGGADPPGDCRHGMASPGPGSWTVWAHHRKELDMSVGRPAGLVSAGPWRRKAQRSDQAGVAWGISVRLWGGTGCGGSDARPARQEAASAVTARRRPAPPSSRTMPARASLPAW